MRRYVAVRVSELRKQVAGKVPDRPNPKPGGLPLRGVSIRFEVEKGSGRNGGGRVVSALLIVRAVDPDRLNDMNKIDARTTAQLDRWCASVSARACVPGVLPIRWEAEGGI